MKYGRFIYMTGNIQMRREEIANIRDREELASLYAVTVSESSSLLLNVYPPLVLKQAYYRDSDELVIGFASSKEEADELAAYILNCVYAERQDFDVKAYLASKEEEAG